MEDALLMEIKSLMSMDMFQIEKQAMCHELTEILSNFVRRINKETPVTQWYSIFREEYERQRANSSVGRLMNENTMMTRTLSGFFFSKLVIALGTTIMQKVGAFYLLIMFYFNQSLSKLIRFQMNPSEFLQFGRFFGKLKQQGIFQHFEPMLSQLINANGICFANGIYFYEVSKANIIYRQKDVVHTQLYNIINVLQTSERNNNGIDNGNAMMSTSAEAENSCPVNVVNPDPEAENNSEANASAVNVNTGDSGERRILPLTAEAFRRAGVDPKETDEEKLKLVFDVYIKELFALQLKDILPNK